MEPPILDRLRDAFADALVRDARSLEWEPGTVLDETPVTMAGLRQSVLEHDTFANDVLRFVLPRDKPGYVSRTTGDGNCLYTSVSAGMAMIDLRRKLDETGGWFRVKDGPQHWTVRPNPTEKSHIIRGFDLRLDTVEYYLRGYEEPELADRKTTLEAIASQVEAAPESAVPVLDLTDNDAPVPGDCPRVDTPSSMLTTTPEDESMEAEFDTQVPPIHIPDSLV